MTPEADLIESLAARARSVSLIDGEVLVEQGDAAEKVYFIESGRMSASKSTPQGEVVVGTVETGHVIGEVTVVAGGLRTATPRAFGTDDVISGVLVEGEPTSIPPGAKTMSADEVAQSVLDPLEGANASIDLVRALLWIVAAIIVGAVVYLSALDRQRDFAVLKAVGAPNRALLGSLALQAVLVALLAVGVATIIQIFLAPRFPLSVTVPGRAFWQLPLLAVVMALIAGAVGMRKVLRSDPSQAFSGAGA